ncbi:GFA family protein [uncultured Paracoccus sp.]|uniref:GFA family protein n=1 Tax=uncultured Paracoccus sp. TaxID=189685 RepID=UPI00260CB8D5|nr:GFA family protein [uncultured Paracoccus sp.]
MIAGSCLCGAVRFSGHPETPHVIACHCSQCRKWSGHVWASFHLTSARIEGEVRWFRSSDHAERGFCPSCGTSLFWRLEGREVLSVSAGALTDPTGLNLGEHIYAADKGDYYEIADNLPRKDQD